MVPIVWVRGWTARVPVLAEELILASRTRLIFKGLNGSGEAEGFRKSFSALESCWWGLLRRKVLWASCGVYRLEIYLSGEVDGVLYPDIVILQRPLGVRSFPSSAAEVGVNFESGAGVKGKGEGSRSSLEPSFVDGVLEASPYSETGGEGYERPPSLQP